MNEKKHRSRFALTLILVLPFLLTPCRPLLAGKPLPDRPRPLVVGQSQLITVAPELGDAVLIGDRYHWNESVTVKDAAFLKPHFVNVNLRTGDMLTVRSATGKVVDQITGRGPRQAGSFWGLSAFGDTLSLELSFREPYSERPFQVDQVIIGDARMLDLAAGGEGYKSVCEPPDFEDVICYQGEGAKWSNVLASVGVMSVGGNPASGLWCSGSNVSPLSYLLTNHHCIADSSECASAEFVFKYYRTGCNDGSPPNADWQSYRCDQVVASSPVGDCDATPSTLDFSLSSVIGDPAATFGYVTPDAAPLTDGEPIYLVQHPAGRPHEITHGSNVEIDGSTIRYYDTLDTEGGSSGSPIFREADGLLVGLHHCGGCSTPGVGNRGMLMSDIYPAIEPYLCTPALDLVAGSYSGLAEVAGNGDGVIDPGETWQLVPAIRNISCTTAAVNVAADLAVNPSSAMPVTLLDTHAVFGAITAGETVSAVAPIRFRIGSTLACTDQVLLDLVNITAEAGGPFADAPGYLAETLGEVPTATLLFEDFAAGLPGTWTVIDGGTGSGAAATWTDANPGSRALSLTAPFMIADSDALGSTYTMNEELISPMIDATGSANVTLRFAHDFHWYSSGNDEQADVDVRSTATGGTWVTVKNFSGGDASGTLSVDISAQAGGQNDVQIRFHYYNAVYEWWWAVDDVTLLGDNGRVCSPVGLAVPEDFEGYGSTVQLEGIWFDSSGTPLQELDAVTPNNGGGAQSMRLAYDVTGSDSAVRSTFPVAEDWSSAATLFWWYRGEVTNSNDPVSLLVLDTAAAACQVTGGPADQPGWNQVVIDLPSTCSGINLAAVAAIDIGVRQGTGSGTGTIWIDDITFDGAVPVKLQSLSIE